MSIVITGYEALCNLGNNINSIYEKALAGNVSCFEDLTGYLKDTTVHAGIIHCELPQIYEPDYNIRSNRLILKTLDLLKEKINSLLDKYSPDKIGVIAATTNSGVEEYEKSHNPAHFELGNSACFLHKHLNLKGFYTTVSTACSSGIKAFSLARDLINNNISDAVIIACVDSFTKLPVFGFHSLEVLSDKPSLPFSKNRKGMNIGEACAIFVVEKDTQGIEIKGLGESSDIYHPTTPDPQAKEVIKAISTALTDAKITAEDIDYINAHGTGSSANDLMEATAISAIFGNKTPISSTKPLTGHCLGAAAGIETALCCKLLDDFKGMLYPEIYDGIYDDNLPEIKLVKKEEHYPQCKICMCSSFGFGGTNAILILGQNNG